MNKKQIILIISIVVFIAVLVGINILLNNVNNNNNNNEVAINDSIINTQQTQTNVIKVDTDSWGDMVLNESKYVLVDFYALWCGPCKMISPLIEEIAQDSNYTNDFSFCKLNVDDDSQIAIDYGVQYLPTLIIFKDGEEVARSVGYLEKDQLIQFIQSVK